MFKYTPIVIVASLLLAACQGANGITCPQLKQYSPEFLQEVSREVARIDAPNSVQLLKDYGVTRDAIRICLSQQAKELRSTAR